MDELSIMKQSGLFYIFNSHFATESMLIISLAMVLQCFVIFANLSHQYLSLYQAYYDNVR